MNPVGAMVRLAHFSDIHVTSPTLDWQWRDWFNKRYAAWFNFRWLGRRRRFRHADEVLGALVAGLQGEGVDHVIFSGDATALGFEEEFKRAATLLGVTDPPRFPGMAVPGNHDYCTQWAAASGAFERHFAPWQVGRRVDGALYPFAQKVGPVWLIGVNSSTGNRWAWDAAGSVGADQLNRLRRLLQELEPGPRILVTHYPVCLASGAPERRTHCLRDMVELVKVAAAGGVGLWLHGHRHNYYFLARPKLSPFPIICAGSATQTAHWSYGDYRVEGETCHAEIRVFDPSGGRFKVEKAFDIPLPG